LPDNNPYTRSKLVTRQQKIAKSVICVIENIDKHYEFYTNWDAAYKQIPLLYSEYDFKTRKCYLVNTVSQRFYI